ncbi:putative aspartic-type endopeptidase protein [Neofusicoccum parvum]|uniref:Aspartic-type endopeptidase protein n=1 Tax=Neofusicoccum parvum TaxID=310453 RepID=A0ACB5SJI2_9PEZI|nr:putative aspartic-type endopeptidase protein [Neofusicoccum parvum]
MNSAQFEPSNFTDEAGIYTTDVLGLQGPLRYVSDRFTLRDQDTGSFEYLDRIGTAVADNVSVTIPGGKSYTLDVGYLSLYGGQSTVNWTAANGSAVAQNLSLPRAYAQDVIPSISYGLHVGSAAHSITGSLVWGGYDQSRVIGAPITAANNSFFNLTAITLGVASGRSAFLNTTTPTPNLLRTNDSTPLPLSARPDPGIPHLYLPPATCAAIAAHLPVTYIPAYGLYLWDTTTAAFTAITSSPHHLALTFAPNTTIALPFALLNLTLSPPLVDFPATYFPCRPWTPPPSSAPSALLGRAFLQAAFLGQNWQTGAVWLAQAPGPRAAAQSVKSIEPGDGALTPAPELLGWERSWEGVLTALEGGTETAGGGGGWSTGAKVGVGVGAAVGGVVVVAGVVGVGVWRRRRRGRRRRASGTWRGGELEGREVGELDAGVVAELASDARKKEPGELGGEMVCEMDGGWVPPVVEKPA